MQTNRTEADNAQTDRKMVQEVNDIATVVVEDKKDETPADNEIQAEPMVTKTARNDGCFKLSIIGMTTVAVVGGISAVVLASTTHDKNQELQLQVDQLQKDVQALQDGNTVKVEVTKPNLKQETPTREEQKSTDNSTDPLQLKGSALRAYKIQLVTSAIDLNDEDILDELQDDGLDMEIGANTDLKIIENATTGYIWNIKHNCNEDEIDVFDEVIEIQPSTSRDDEHYYVGAPRQRVVSIDAADYSECTLNMALARPWMFSWDDLENSEYSRMIEIPIWVD